MTEHPVLVLNRLYQPVHVTHAQRAICLMYMGAARALGADYQLFDFLSWTKLGDSMPGRLVRTVHMSFVVPKVVVLRVYDRLPKSRIRFSRQSIFIRDAYTCQYCNQVFNKKQLNLDHVIPRSQGGSTSWENVVTSCIDCNFSKGPRTPEQAHMRLKRMPRKPAWSQFLPTPRLQAYEQEWLPFFPDRL